MGWRKAAMKTLDNAWLDAIGPILRFRTILADPPWRFRWNSAKGAPDNPRHLIYDTMCLEDICGLPVARLAAHNAHLYLWIPIPLIAEGLEVMKAWSFEYRTALVWIKTRQDGGVDGGGLGYYFRGAAEIILFGVRGKKRTTADGRTACNVLMAMGTGHSRKPDSAYDLIERCSPDPRVELFARRRRVGWTQWGDQLEPEEVAHATGT
jgi:N6-adenosine-specific RNA methylase IME4